MPFESVFAVSWPAVLLGFFLAQLGEKRTVAVWARLNYSVHGLIIGVRRQFDKILNEDYYVLRGFPRKPFL